MSVSFLSHFVLITFVLLCSLFSAQAQYPPNYFPWRPNNNFRHPVRKAITVADSAEKFWLTNKCVYPPMDFFRTFRAGCDVPELDQTFFAGICRSYFNTSKELCNLDDANNDEIETMIAINQLKDNMDNSELCDTLSTLRLNFPNVLPVPKGKDNWFESIYDLIFSANTCESVCSLDHMHPICFGFFLNYDYIANVFGRNQSDTENPPESSQTTIANYEITDDVTTKIDGDAGKEVTDYTNYDAPNDQKSNDDVNSEKNDDDIVNFDKTYDGTDNTEGSDYDHSVSIEEKQDYDYGLDLLGDVKGISILKDGSYYKTGTEDYVDITIDNAESQTLPVLGKDDVTQLSEPFQQNPKLIVPDLPSNEEYFYYDDLDPVDSPMNGKIDDESEIILSEAIQKNPKLLSKVIDGSFIEDHIVASIPIDYPLDGNYDVGLVGEVGLPEELLTEIESQFSESHSGYKTPLDHYDTQSEHEINDQVPLLGFMFIFSSALVVLSLFVILKSRKLIGYYIRLMNQRRRKNWNYEKVLTAQIEDEDYYE